MLGDERCFWPFFGANFREKSACERVKWPGGRESVGRVCVWQAAAERLCRRIVE